MNIAITGATGYIGSNLVKKLSLHHKLTLLVRKNLPSSVTSANVRVVTVNFNNRPSIRKALRKISVVYHLAGALPNLPISDKEYFDINGRLALRVYQAATASPSVKQFILCSTAYVTWKNGRPTDENSAPNPSTVYERSKLEGENLVRSLAKKKNLPVTIVRPGFVYGKQGLGLLSLTRAIKSGKFFYIGGGDQLFELTHIDDLTRFFNIVLENKNAYNQTFIVSSGRPKTLKNICEIIAKTLLLPKPGISIPGPLFKILIYPVVRLADLFHIPFPVSLETYKTITTPRSFKVDKAARMLGYNDHINHRLAIKKLVLWYKQESLV